MQKIELIPLIDRRPSLFDLWTIYKFNTGVLAIKAKVPPGTIQSMLGNQPVHRREAEKVLEQLSALLHKEYTLQTVYVVLVAEKEATEPL
jgi:hypothetical protein